MIELTRSQPEPNAVARYPEHREADVVIRDGSVVHIRPVRATDEPAAVPAGRVLKSLSVDARRPISARL